MKRVIISDRQKRMICESSANGGSDSCVDDIRIEERLSGKRKNEVISNFRDDIESYPVKEIANKLNVTAAKIARHEKSIKGKLVELCLKTVSELFDIPTDDVSINIEITDEIHPEKSFRVNPDTDEEYEYDSYDDIEADDAFVEKRKLLNAIVMGASMRLADKAKAVYLEELFDLDEELPHLYSMLTKINEYLLFRAKFRITDKQHFQSGYSDVKIGDDTHASTVQVYACNFPSALVETINGLLQVVISGSLMNDRELADSVIGKTDILGLEPSNMKLGPAMWDLLIGDATISSKDVPDYVNGLSKIDAVTFNRIMKDVLYNTARGKEIARQMLEQFITGPESQEYDDSELVSGDDEQGIIEDDIY